MASLKALRRLREFELVNRYLFTDNIVFRFEEMYNSFDGNRARLPAAKRSRLPKAVVPSVSSVSIEQRGQRRNG